MNAKQRSFLVNLNRTLIFALYLVGLLLDGFQLADVPVSIAQIFIDDEHIGGFAELAQLNLAGKL